MGLWSKSIEIDLAKATLSDWQHVSGSLPASGAIKNGAYQLGAHQGGVSKVAIRAKPGKSYVVKFRARTLSPATKGAAPNYHCSPIFFDRTGKNITWPRRFEGMPDGREQKIAVVAPKEAAEVRIAVFGSWAPPNVKPADTTIALDKLKLSEA